MSRQLEELESVLRRMIDEHRTLLLQIDAQQQAMRSGKTGELEQALHLQESSRRRIGKLESRRRQLATQIGRAMRMADVPTVSVLAKLFPARSQALLELRDELKGVLEELSQRTRLVARLSASVLGHLNSAVRMICAAVEQAGVYTRSGAPLISSRIGVMEAVG